MPRLWPLLAIASLATNASLNAQVGDTAFHPVQVLNAREVGVAIGEYYPATLRNLEISGYVALKLRVGADDKVKDSDILISSGVHAFDRAAERVVPTLVLRAARRGATPVETQTVVPITFQGRPKKGWLHLKQGRALNRDSVRALGSAVFPAELRAQALNARAALTLDVDRSGSVTKAVLNQTSCFRKTDDVALELGRKLRFAPIAAADVEKAQVNVTVSFQNDSVFLRVAGDTLLADTVPKSPRAPVFSVKPELVNRTEMATKLARAYPDSEKRDTVQALVWMLVAEDGTVARRQIEDSSDNCLVDVRVLDVLKEARFTPALLDNVPVRVWIQLPIIMATPDTRKQK